MATYQELNDLHENNELRAKITMAIVVAADSIRALPTPTPGQVTWAKEAFADPASKVNEMLWALLAANKDVTLANITGAADTAIQAAVDAAVPLFTG